MMTLTPSDRNLLDQLSDHAHIHSLMSGSYDDEVAGVLSADIADIDDPLLAELYDAKATVLKETAADHQLNALLMQRKDHIESFRRGIRGYITIRQHKSLIKRYDVLLDKLKVESYTSGKPLDRMIVDHIITKQQKLQSAIDTLLQYQEVAVVEHYYRIKSMARAKQAKQFVSFDSRDQVIDQSLDALLSGEHVLMEGPTGTGKTVLAKEIATRVQSKLGKPAYRMNQGGAQGVLSKSDFTPDERADLIREVLIVVNGYPQMHPNELMQKLSMKGDIKVTEELVGMLKAIHEGRPIIIDEIDTIPTPTLMSIKSLFTIKSGELFAPQGGTGQTLYEAGRAPMVIATMNGRSAKHETRVSMDPAILRLFGYQTTVSYLSKAEKYDYLLAQLQHASGYIADVTHHELTDQTSGIVPVFVDFVDQVEQRYLGVDAEAMPEFSDADLSRKQKGRLSKKVLELGKLSTFVSKWQLQTEYYDLSGTKYHGRQTLTDYIQSEVLQWCVGPSTTEDKLILLHMALRLGLISSSTETRDYVIQQMAGVMTETMRSELVADVGSSRSHVHRGAEDDLLIDARQQGGSSPWSPDRYISLSSMEYGVHGEQVQYYRNLLPQWIADPSVMAQLQSLLQLYGDHRDDSDWAPSGEQCVSLVDAIRSSEIDDNLKQQTLGSLRDISPHYASSITDADLPPSVDSHDDVSETDDIATDLTSALTGKISDYPYLHPADDVSLDPEQNGGKILNQGYLEYDDKKVPMFRNEDIPQAFNEMGIRVKEAKNTTEATTYLQKLFKDYRADFPDAFAETDWFSTWNKTKFKLFDKRATDHGLDYAGYQRSDGKHRRPGEALSCWLPVRLGGKFAYLYCARDVEGAECDYGHESDALPVAVVKN